MKIRHLTDVPEIAKYLTRIGANGQALKTAVVQVEVGTYKKDVATIAFDAEGAVKVSSWVRDPAEYEPTSHEADAIKEAWKKITWPQIRPIHNIAKPPPMIKNADPKDIYEFRDTSKMIVMVQVRIEKEDGTGKSYVPWTFWDDDEWRCAEPDGPLPLFNGDRISESETIFIHEGAKAAKYVQWMVDGKSNEAKAALKAHPWGRELSRSVHVGWIGGAMNPRRTDWSAIAKLGAKRAYIVADNDQAGRDAVRHISHDLTMTTFVIQFTSEFPPAFDLADPFSDKMFEEIHGVKNYVGPTFRACTHPATWATRLIPKPKGESGRPTCALRDAFKAQWKYVLDIDSYVCTEMPDKVLSEKDFNNSMAPYSDTEDTARLFKKNNSEQNATVTYRPGGGLTVTHKGSQAINLHVPSEIRAAKGDVTPFLEFMAYVFVNPEERKEVARWCATLIARPEVRMGYGLLLISEMHGIGKTTLGEHILAPLVGTQNVGFPSERDIVESQFNGWLAQKRLVVINEIYNGSSWKAYHALKTVITDKSVQVNQKYMRQYTIENWCHILACSNSRNALKMEDEDRRWFYPEIAEVPWPKAKFIELRKWLQAGGLGIIKNWADEYGDYVGPADRAPSSERKKEMIAESRSDAKKDAVALAYVLAGMAVPAAIFPEHVREWLMIRSKDRGTGKVYETTHDLMKVMKQVEGLREWPAAMKVSGKDIKALVTTQLFDRLQRLAADQEIVEMTDPDQKARALARARTKMIREFKQMPEDVAKTALATPPGPHDEQVKLMRNLTLHPHDLEEM